MFATDPIAAGTESCRANRPARPVGTRPLNYYPLLSEGNFGRRDELLLGGYAGRVSGFYALTDSHNDAAKLRTCIRLESPL
jgi:hypothetical protein